MWKPIEGYEGYEISNSGNVRNKHGRQLKPIINKNGYAYVNLYREGSMKHIFIHRLVAIAFLPNDSKRQFVNHIDGIKTNNTAGNLEWCTSRENNLHAIRTGLIKINTNGLVNRTIPVVCYNRETGETTEFQSGRECSRYFGKSADWASKRINSFNGKYKQYVLKQKKLHNGSSVTSTGK